MKLNLISLLFVCAVQVFGLSKKPAETDYFLIKKGGMNIQVRFVKEMENIPSIDTCKLETGAGKSDSETVNQLLKKISLSLEKIITAQKVLENSNYARDEMEKGYKKVSSLNNIDLLPLNKVCDSNIVIYKGTIDSLPSHSPIVKRYLVIYALYSLSDKMINDVYVTIRGTLSE